ncbi:MAG TPA: hypothetical protein VMH05_02380 [Bryobacteraceae bacterium]|nr:hypothetical protein [Bryobacteraceae bacterium]
MKHDMAAPVVSKLLALTLAAGSALLAAPAERKQAQAQILEQASIPCHNCFFGNTYYFFCFDADNQILLAQDKIPTMNYSDANKNFLGKVHKSWRNPLPSSAPLTISYDDQHLWMTRADGKLIRLKRENSHDVFTNPRCRAAVKKPGDSR